GRAPRPRRVARAGGGPAACRTRRAARGAAAHGRARERAARERRPARRHRRGAVGRGAAARHRGRAHRARAGGHASTRARARARRCRPQHPHRARRARPLDGRAFAFLPGRRVMDVRLLPWRAALAAGLALTLGAATAASLGARLLPAADDAAVTLVWRVSVLVLLAGITWSLVELLGLAREYRWLAAMKRRSSIDRLLRGDALPRPRAVWRGRCMARLGRAEAAVPADLRASLRAEAQAASAAIGSATRFFASLLLLLAVLGTFAGMKAALPRLTAAIRPDAAEVDPASIQQALAGIAAAFGANFLALLGAVILAVLAFGLAAERRHLLAALEHVSERYLYPLLPAGSDVSALQRAVQDMRLSANAVELVGDGVRDLQSTIRSLEQTLV